MSRCVFSFWIISLASAGCMLLACGGSNPRTLQSVTVSPASTDAQAYSDGRVPFVATGKYNLAPMTVTPLQANWAAVSERVVNGILTLGPITSAVSVDQTGVAQCEAGAGTFAVIAWDLQDPTTKTGCASETDFGEPGCNAVQGMAQLTCP